MAQDQVTNPEQPSIVELKTMEKNKENIDAERIENQVVTVEKEKTETKSVTEVKPAEQHDTKKRTVTFDEAEVIEFEPTVWTATVSSDGVPIGMSTNVRRRTRRRLDSYEGERLLQRVDRQVYMEHGYLEPEERLDILEAAGHSISIISHVERETIRINRERWESNEYDLLHQYGLGEVPVMELDRDDDDEMLLVQQDNDDVLMCLEGEDSEQDYYYSSQNVSVEAEVRFAMEEMDSYDTRRYEQLAIDYADDCILGDDSDSDETNELPYAKDSFDLPVSFDLVDMSSSPSDVSATADCMIVACSTHVNKVSVSSPGPSADAKNVVVAV